MASRLLPAGSMISADQPPKSLAEDVRTRPPRNSSGPKRFASGRSRSKCAMGRASISMCSTRVAGAALSSANARARNGVVTTARSPPATARRWMGIGGLASIMSRSCSLVSTPCRARERRPSRILLQFAAVRGQGQTVRLVDTFLEELHELVGHGASELGGISDGDGTTVVARHVVANADGDELDGGARLDLLDDLAQMALQIAARVHGQRRVVDRCTIRNHHQDAAALGACQQSPVCPRQRLPVDVLLEQALAHHQGEGALGTAPGSVGRLVYNVSEVVEATGIGRLACGEPGFACLSTLPGPGGEAQNFHLDAATLEGPRQ